MQKWAETFYKSSTWVHTAAAYKRSVGGLCENCLKKGYYKPAEMVHHKIPLTPENITVPEIALSFDNFEALCRDCHAERHSKVHRRYRFNELGQVIER